MSIFKIILNTFPRPILIKLSYLAKPFIAFWLRGNNYTDPIDGKTFRKFLSYGYGKQRENALSPSTLSLERHRLLWLYLQNETDFFKPELDSSTKILLRNYSKDVENSSALRVLHMAPEQCFLSIFRKQKNLEYTTSDLHSPIADVKADICNLPFDDNSFDVVLCNHVLEHISDDTKAMQELYRVLKPNGMGIFQIPQDNSRATTFEDNSITDKKERAQVFGQYDHVRIYGRDYFDKLRSIGFKVDEVDYTKKITPEMVERFCLSKDEILPVCFKSKT
ncbi:MAG: putative SAM-dependent methyltransferase [Polaribacter sp.]